MEKPNVIQFYIQNDPDGGYTAEAVGYSIFTQGETLDDIVKNIQEFRVPYIIICCPHKIFTFSFS